MVAPQESSHLSLLISASIGMYLLFSMISISISQIFLAAALIGWIGLQIKKKRWPGFPPFFWFLIVYAGFSVVSSFFSVNPEISFVASRDLLLLLLVPIVYAGFSQAQSLKRTHRVLLLSFFIMAAYTLWYYYFKSVPGERITGFMGHWMTQAGLLLIFCSMALALFFFRSGVWRYVWGAAFLLGLPLIVLTLTRNAWVGLICAVVTLLFLYKPKALLVIPALVAVFFLISPKPVKDRALSIFDMRNMTNRERFEYWKAGVEIIKDFALFGTGPDTVDMVFQNSKYGLSPEAKNNVHLHNNFLQIGAERGLFALAVWVGFLVALFLSLLRMLRQREEEIFPYAAAALAVFVGLMFAGLFEYNFGDSEVVVLFLYIITVPFSLERMRRDGS